MGSHYRGTKVEIRALDAYIKLLRAAESVSARTSQYLGATGLTLSQFGVLEALLHLGPLCQRALGEKILKSSGNITVVVDHLEKRGWVERKREGDDRRFVTVHLTPQGRRLIRGIFPRHARAILKEMGALKPREQKQLGRLCRRLGLQKRK